jgi:tripartite-type tricarboxylate transporter receptor subunit TctC
VQRSGCTVRKKTIFIETTMAPRTLAISLTVLITSNAAHVGAQTFPSKPLRIVAGAAGGGSDFTARVIAQGLGASLGQQVIVDNRGGLDAVQAGVVLNAPPDGYTLILGTNGLWVGQLILDSPSYDTLKDFSPITVATRSPNILVVHPSLPVKSVKELIALAKSKPGALSYASGPVGSAPHLAPELFKVMAGVDILRIPYKGGGPGLIALAGGQAQLMFAVASGGVMTTYVAPGRLRALAVTTALPSALAPGLPTVAAAGLPGYEADTIAGVLARSGTPASIINRLNSELVQLLNKQDVKDLHFKAGTEVVSSSPEGFLATLKTEISKWGKLIRDAHIRLE